MTIMTRRPIRSTGCQYFSYNIHHSGFSDTEQENNREENDGKDRCADSEIKGCSDISYVDAAVRGIASMGPMHRTMALIRIIDGIFPIRFTIASVLPRAHDGEERYQRQTDVRYIIADKTQKPLGTGFQTRYGGKITFPAPKNMEKRAKPITKISLPICRIFIGEPPL